MIFSISVDRWSWEKIDPVLPMRSRTRRISGANITGIANNKVGRVLEISQENAGSTLKLDNKLITTIRNKTPRSNTNALVSRSR